MAIITDLTNTTWYVPAGWSISAGFASFTVNATINDEVNMGFVDFGYGDYNSDDGSFSPISNSIAFWAEAGNPVFILSDNSFNITITGGTDATNTSLITWLETNGELQVEETPAVTITYNGVTIASLVTGQTAILPCKGKKMKDDIVIAYVKDEVISTTHALYNGVRLPVIPPDVLSQYPYAWIRNNTSSAQYQLVLAAYPWYYNADYMYCSGGEDKTEVLYNISTSSALTATEWTFSKNVTGKFGAEIARPIMWANHNIPNGSATAT